MRLVLLALLLAFQSAHAQQYTVIHVIGKIYDRQSNSYLKPGSKVGEDSKLKFESPNARAAALSTSRGRYVIQQENVQNGNSDLAYTLSAVLAPARGKMSTRAGGINNQLDFVKKFGEGPIAIVGGRYAAAVSPTSYPSDDQRFFYASYEYQGETINKKLEVFDDELVFEAITFYAVDGQAIDPNQTSNAKLFYFDSNIEESTEITDLQFVVVSHSDLMTIKNSIGYTGEGEQAENIQAVISSLYGACDLAQIKTALAKSN